MRLRLCDTSTVAYGLRHFKELRYAARGVYRMLLRTAVGDNYQRKNDENRLRGTTLITSVAAARRQGHNKTKHRERAKEL